jgi:hypothetical protein
MFPDPLIGSFTSFYLRMPITVFFFLLLIFIFKEGKEDNLELEVFDFKGAGGVALAMYNTDEVY